jgi:hypothetical protein
MFCHGYEGPAAFPSLEAAGISFEQQWVPTHAPAAMQSLSPSQGMDKHNRRLGELDAAMKASSAGAWRVNEMGFFVEVVTNAPVCAAKHRQYCHFAAMRASSV